MKEIILCVIICFSVSYTAEDEEIICAFELFLGTKNISAGVTTTFTITKFSTLWDENYNIVSEYNGGSMTIYENSPTGGFYQGFNFVTSLTGETCMEGYAGDLAYGVYRIDVVSNNHLNEVTANYFFYLDYRDCHYGQPNNNYNGKIDVWLLCDGQEHTLSFSTTGYLSGYTSITNGSTVGVWTMFGLTGVQDRSSFQPEPATNLSVSSQTNPETSVAEPYLTWTATPGPFWTGYNIYRSINTQGGPPGTYTLIASVGQNTTSYRDEGLTAGGSWKVYYKIKAKNNNKESDFSNMAEIGSSGFYKSGSESQENTSGKISKFHLMQNNPNPFNPQTTILYDLPSNEKVLLRVFNIIGKEIAVLENREMPAGRYTVTFNATDLPSGIYFYSLIAREFSSLKKMAFIK